MSTSCGRVSSPSKVLLNMVSHSSGAFEILSEADMAAVSQIIRTHAVQHFELRFSPAEISNHDSQKLIDLVIKAAEDWLGNCRCFCIADFAASKLREEERTKLLAIIRSQGQVLHRVEDELLLTVTQDSDLQLLEEFTVRPDTLNRILAIIYDEPLEIGNCHIGMVHQIRDFVSRRFSGWKLQVILRHSQPYAQQEPPNLPR